MDWLGLALHYSEKGGNVRMKKIINIIVIVLVVAILLCIGVGLALKVTDSVSPDCHRWPCEMLNNEDYHGQ
jgi:formate hydrogenlyase subunit 3/multisubunit Na+/H+ antiporter MnhD subunit